MPPRIPLFIIYGIGKAKEIQEPFVDVHELDYLPKDFAVCHIPKSGCRCNADILILQEDPCSFDGCCYSG
ncbi:hypothetical protein VNO78_17228 [Psophocarpus tetragonolobus]|uniref:Uncharacterized protein n=1 Tax=Psophocarpus tetragonolobus TaxID=3891 RepID=A0AAN9XKL2_PSOTE